MAQARAPRPVLGIHTETTSQLFAALVGAVFLIVGILGFIPGVTTDYDDMAFAGTGSHAELFGVFQVSVLHNLVHLAFGVIGLAATRTVVAARTFLVVGGLIYLVLALYGAVIDKGSDANFVPINTADDWLHVGLGLGMVLLAVAAGTRLSDFAGGRRRPTR